MCGRVLVKSQTVLKLIHHLQMSIPKNDNHREGRLCRFGGEDSRRPDDECTSRSLAEFELCSESLEEEEEVESEPESDSEYSLTKEMGAPYSLNLWEPSRSFLLISLRSFMLQVTSQVTTRPFS